jgi:hypothetical protein
LGYNDIDLPQKTVPGYFFTLDKPKQCKVLFLKDFGRIFNHLIDGNEIGAIIVRIYGIFLGNQLSLLTTILNDVVDIDFDLLFFSELGIERRSQIKLA